ncbi:uncharacterized protein LOC130048779 [Ostrea edulis]|uniref:uncharacterized protein LOC130048779 n=1 Tax=Ostrea edulis TaxID=37623 RepID=UPI0024AF8E67|nr:uncharacterized protein LOC130048779 [Ostrea edulis]
MSDAKSSWEKIKEHVGCTPTMVFSVIGDSDSLDHRPWTKTVFQTALIEAAKSGGESWVLYRGYTNGVSDIVRDAYRNYGYTEFDEGNFDETLKLTEWSVEEYNEHIKKSRRFVERNVKLIKIAGDQKINSKSPPEYIEVAGTGNDFLLKFEKFVSEQKMHFFSKKGDFGMQVPIAIIVCEGDIETIAHISDALEQKLPVVIIKGSGKAADFILDYLKNSKILMKKVRLFGMHIDEDTYAKMTTYLKTIKKKKKWFLGRLKDAIGGSLKTPAIRLLACRIGVFDVDNDDPLMLSNIVGETIVKCWAIENIPSSESKNPEQSECHMVREILNGYREDFRPYVLNPKYPSPTSLPLYFYTGYQFLQETKTFMDNGHILLLEAMKANRCDYVRVLLDRGVKLKIKDLPELYDQTVSCVHCRWEDNCHHMQWILKQSHESKAKIVCQEYRSVMGELKNPERHCATQEEETYIHKKCELGKKVSNAAKRLCRKLLRNKENEETSEQTPDSKQNDTPVEHANISDLLLWAIFANRKELAEIYWLQSEDHILTGLVCSALLKKLAKKANNVRGHVLSSGLEEHSNVFARLPINAKFGRKQDIFSLPKELIYNVSDMV